MEGAYFGAGPWFTVQRDGSDWQVLDRIELADGTSQRSVDVQIKLSLEPAGAEPMTETIARLAEQPLEKQL